MIYFPWEDLNSTAFHGRREKNEHYLDQVGERTPSRSTSISKECPGLDKVVSSTISSGNWCVEESYLNLVYSSTFTHGPCKHLNSLGTEDCFRMARSVTDEPGRSGL